MARRSVEVLEKEKRTGSRRSAKATHDVTPTAPSRRRLPFLTRSTTSTKCRSPDFLCDLLAFAMMSPSFALKVSAVIPAFRQLPAFFSEMAPTTLAPLSRSCLQFGGAVSASLCCKLEFA